MEKRCHDEIIRGANCIQEGGRFKIPYVPTPAPFDGLGDKESEEFLFLGAHGQLVLRSKTGVCFSAPVTRARRDDRKRGSW